MPRIDPDAVRQLENEIVIKQLEQERINRERLDTTEGQEFDDTKTDRQKLRDRVAREQGQAFVNTPEIDPRNSQHLPNREPGMQKYPMMQYPTSDNPMMEQLMSFYHDENV
jgi:hypothetical protein